MGDTSKWAMTWDDIQVSMDSLIRDIKNNRLEVSTIVAVAKGGLIPAAMVWQEFPEANLVVLRTASYGPKGKTPPVILNPEVLVHQIPDSPATLVIDDICDSGDTFRMLERRLPSVGFACMLARSNPEDQFEIDHMGSYVSEGRWVDFPWERQVAAEIIPVF